MAVGTTQPLTEMSTRNISWGWRWPVRRADNLTTFMCRLSWNLGASTSWNPQGLSRPVMGLLYLLPLTSAGIKNDWSPSYTIPYAFMACVRKSLLFLLLFSNLLYSRFSFSEAIFLSNNLPLNGKWMLHFFQPFENWQNCFLFYFILWPTMHNYFTIYHTPTCFDTVVSPSGSL